MNIYSLKPGINDLKTLYPEIAEEWDQDKNGILQPDQILPGSEKKIWWKCREYGHSWNAYVFQRTAGHGCPYCAGNRILAGFNDLKTLYPRIACEWDHEKNGAITPDQVASYSQRRFWWRCGLGHSWQATPSKRVQGEGCPYCCGNKVWSGFNDLGTSNPELIDEWDEEKNAPLKISDVSKGSVKKVWWRCQKGHSWQAVIYSRAGNGSSGCPYCNGSKVWPGFNDLATVNPLLASQWDVGKNAPVLPNQVSSGTNKKFWWRCEEGHSWQALISARTRGTGCPVCAGRTVLAGFNDLATLNPHIAAEWNDSKNGNLHPTDVTPGSHKKIWWRCSAGHEWNTSPANRTNGTGCPYCSGKLVRTGETDLATLFPQYISEWVTDKNLPDTPSTVPAGTSRIFWWRCSQGHEWRASVHSRTNRKNGCPYCGNRKALPGVTDFATKHPQLMMEWDFERNTEIVPSSLTERSHKQVWWKCKEGHSWKTSCFNRATGSNCPYCSYKEDKHIVVPGVNDLQSKHPELMDEWDHNRNGDLKPSMVMPHSNRQVWWKCPNNHHWRSSPNQRLRGSGCPYCLGYTPPRTRII